MDYLPDIATMNKQEMEVALQEAQDKLDYVSIQISNLDAEIDNLRKMYRLAVKNGRYGARYNLRMQLSIISGVKVMHNHYATAMEERASSLVSQLRIQAPVTDTSDNSDSNELVDDRLES